MNLGPTDNRVEALRRLREFEDTRGTALAQLSELVGQPLTPDRDGLVAAWAWTIGLIGRLLPTPRHPYRHNPPDHPDVEIALAGLTALVADALLRAVPGARLGLLADPDDARYHDVQVVNGDRGFAVSRAEVSL